MAKEGIKIQNLFLGGLSEGKYTTSRNKVPFMVGCNIRDELGLIKANQNMKAITDGAVPDELPSKIIVCTNGNTYIFSEESGKIWELDSNNNCTLIYTTTPISGSAAILDAEEYSSYLYWTTQNYIHRIRVNRIADWNTYVEPNWKALTLDQPELGFDTDTVGYAIPTSISEVVADYREFKPQENYLSSIGLKIVDKGTVDITVTVHDSSNILIDSSTLTSAELTSSEVNFFRFDPAVEVDPDNTYHFHVTANSSGGTLGTQISTSTPALTNAYTEIHSISSSQFHPFSIANGVLYVGDRNYIHQIEYDYRSGDHVFSYFALDIPKQYVVSTLHPYNTVLIIGTFSATNVNKCAAYWWNTYSTISYSYEDTVDEAGIWSFFMKDEGLFCSVGVNGHIYQYQEGKLIFYKKIPGNYDNTNQGYIKLNSTVMYKEQLLFGFSSVLGNPAYNGMYSLFQALPGYPWIISLEYAISARNAGELVITQTIIGAVAVRGNDLIISWKRSNGSVGVDIIDFENKHDNPEIRTGVIKSTDELTNFTLRQLVADYADLPSGTDIILGYYKNFSNTLTLPSNSHNDAERLQKIAQTSDNCVAIEAVIKLVVSGNETPKVFGLFIGLD